MKGHDDDDDDNYSDNNVQIDDDDDERNKQNRPRQVIINARKEVTENRSNATEILIKYLYYLCRKMWAFSHAM